MLFNSHLFLFLFLPIVATAFFLLGRLSHRFAATWLAAASLFFYGWWNPTYLLLLLASIGFNFVIAGRIAKAKVTQGSRRRILFTLALGVNLLVLGYYKYADFFLVAVGQLSGTHPELMHVILPLGISFFTFTQIAFLADVYSGKSSEPNLVHYCLFVTYFPHLIAGPVLHHKEMMPQFQEPSNYRFSTENFSIGLTIFAIGLAKKVGLADSLSPYANAVFSSAAAGHDPSFLEAWSGALAYSLQLYFDFSGYSDMAIGLSRMFNIVLPLNFNSPYRATSMIEFWRSWHMTLSRFLRDYLYIPLGGGHNGRFRRYRNLMITMLLGGLWHGARWTFILWGGLHGIYLVINHAWRWWRARNGADLAVKSTLGCFAGRLLTFLAVVVAWVVFRADNLETAQSMLQGMAGIHGFLLQEQRYGRFEAITHLLEVVGVRFGDLPALESVRAIRWMLPLVLLCWVLPNTQELMARFRPALDFGGKHSMRLLAWKPTAPWGIAVGAVTGICVLYISRKSEFLYFQF